MRVALFITCFNDTIFPQTGRAVVRVLERLGHAVDFPMDQTCCGQMHYNTGYQREALPLVRRLEVTDVGAAFPERVTYHPTCHSLRVTQVGDAPLRLLRAVEGLELVELPDARECCGFGGTFAVKNAETSTAMAADKCRAIVSTGAGVCTAVDGSCLMQIGGRLEHEHAPVRALHLAEILASESR